MASLSAECVGARHWVCTGEYEINDLQVVWCACRCHNRDVVEEMRRRRSNALLFMSVTAGPRDGPTPRPLAGEAVGSVRASSPLPDLDELPFGA